VCDCYWAAICFSISIWMRLRNMREKGKPRAKDNMMKIWIDEWNKMNNRIVRSSRYS